MTLTDLLFFNKLKLIFAFTSDPSLEGENMARLFVVPTQTILYSNKYITKPT